MRGDPVSGGTKRHLAVSGGTAGNRKREDERMGPHYLQIPSDTAGYHQAEAVPSFTG